ncbi:MAG: magnesium/cobalt transporter CorA, partial [Chloroflexi bacterium]|nr:magnesium/cobalt transporter CorA [Chloroflexota bacterium]
LAVEDCTSPLVHPPKVDDYGDYIFIVVQGLRWVGAPDVVEATELALFLGPNFVVSNHNVPLPSVERVAMRVASSGRHLRRGPDFLAHALIDALVDDVLPIVDRLGDVGEMLEGEVLKSPDQTTLEAIQDLKRSTLRIHRVITPQREMLSRFTHREFSIIREETELFYRDVYGHMVHIGDLNQLVRETAENAVAMYMSVLVVRQNETMKTLAILAGVFIPPTLVASIYGMNFDFMPELRWKFGYFMSLGVMGVAGFVALMSFGGWRWLIRKIRRTAGIRRVFPGAAAFRPG